MTNSKQRRKKGQRRADLTQNAIKPDSVEVSLPIIQTEKKGPGGKLRADSGSNGEVPFHGHRGIDAADI